MSSLLQRSGQIQTYPALIAIAVLAAVAFLRMVGLIRRAHHGSAGGRAASLQSPRRNARPIAIVFNSRTGSLERIEFWLQLHIQAFGLQLVERHP